MALSIYGGFHAINVELLNGRCSFNAFPVVCAAALDASLPQTFGVIGRLRLRLS